MKNDMNEDPGYPHIGEVCDPKFFEPDNKMPEPDCNPSYDSPVGSRETTATILRRRIALSLIEGNLAGLKELARIADKHEPGSPLEFALWQLLVGDELYL